MPKISTRKNSNEKSENSNNDEKGASTEEALKCKVCGISADGQHFGTSACRACAAFFRRTISRRLRYICRFDNDCEIGDATRSVCRSCRLAKCFEVGMNRRAVRSLQSSNSIVRPTPRRVKTYETLPNVCVEEGQNEFQLRNEVNNKNDEDIEHILFNTMTTSANVNDEYGALGAIDVESMKGDEKLFTEHKQHPQKNTSKLDEQHHSQFTPKTILPFSPIQLITHVPAVTVAPSEFDGEVEIVQPQSFNRIWSPLSGSSFFVPESAFAITPIASDELTNTSNFSADTSTTATNPSTTTNKCISNEELDSRITTSSTATSSAITTPNKKECATAPSQQIPSINQQSPKFNSASFIENLAASTIPSSSTSSLSASSSSYEPNKRRKLLYDIVETNAVFFILAVPSIDYFVDESSLPPTHPTLAKMLIGYEGLQRRRDVCFSRSRECNGYTTRIYIERQVFDVHQYWKNIRMEIEWVAEMLSTFDGYRLIPNVDKVHIFKHYWIHFIILERSFDSYRVLGTSPSDLRMVFANGDINDVLVGEYDIKQISDLNCFEMKNISHPWFKHAALELLAPLKKLQPTEPEMIFCLGLMFWKLTYDVASKVTAETAQLAEQMTDLLYREIFDFYSTHFSHTNYVKRVGELVNLIGITERLVLHRKEDIIIQRTFKTFKIDLYMEEIFDTD